VTEAVVRVFVPLITPLPSAVSCGIEDRDDRKGDTFKAGIGGSLKQM
jgi:hypothetical protein